MDNTSNNSASPLKNPKHPQYENYWERLSSYSKWPCTNVQGPIGLSEAGFFYAGFGDCVRCYYCGGGLRNWGQKDKPWIEHARHYPNCAFLLQQKGEAYINYFRSTNNDDDDDDNDDNNNNTNQGDPTNLSSGTGTSLSLGNPAGIIQSTGNSNPRYPEYTLYEKRLITFNNKNHIIPSIELANAGFFYTGVNNNVRCFHCGGGISQWESSDVPWVEHARWYPECPFVVVEKGHEFIKLCINSETNRLGPEYYQKQNGASNNVETGSSLLVRCDTNDLEESVQRHNIAIESLLQMGYEQPVIHNALSHLVKTSLSQKSKFTAEEILSMIFELEKEKEENEKNKEIVRKEEAITEKMATEEERMFHYLDLILNKTPLFQIQDDMTSSSLNLGKKLIARINEIFRPSINDDYDDNGLIYMKRLVKGCSVVKLLIEKLQKLFIDYNRYYFIQQQQLQPEGDRPTATLRNMLKYFITNEESLSALKKSDDNTGLSSNDQLCKVCFDHKLEIIVLPCGHLVTSILCSKKIKKCCICRKLIKERVTVYT